MKIGKYLKFHFECMASNKLPVNGLCNCFKNDDNLKIFEPSEHRSKELYFNGEPYIFWGKDDYSQSANHYSNLRQTIVLLMAAMNGEL